MSCQPLLIIVAVSTLLGSTAAERLSNYTFSSYKAAFRRTYDDGSEEHHVREAAFRKRVALIEEHNSRESTWRMGVSHLSDWTEDEMDRLRGYKRGCRRDAVLASSIVETDGSSCGTVEQSCLDGVTCCNGLVCGVGGVCIEARPIPRELDWNLVLPSAAKGIDQGKCGSCWACAATFAIQMQASILSNRQFTKTLSPQNLVSCTPNTLECGGTGGCDGATPELGFEWAKSMHGFLQTTDDQAYLGETGQCEIKANNAAFLQNNAAKAASGVRIRGWSKLEPNMADKLVSALVSVGPLVTTVAGTVLNNYASGVIDSCKDNTVDHSVVMMGFGSDVIAGRAVNYWKIRNSWGDGWGEAGNFRIIRAYPEAAEPCGWDLEPSKGVACKDRPGPAGKYPTKQWVCGVCGILSDTSYPVGTSVPASLLQVNTE